MRKFLSLFTCVILFCGLAGAQNDTPVPQSSGNEVTNLKLPPSTEVNYDEGFVTVSAVTPGVVKWLVLSTGTKVKFRVQPSVPNELIVAIPPYASVITVFAIADVNGTQTDFARTDITVKESNDPPPNPVPTTDAQPPFHLSIVEDPGTRTAGTKTIVADPSFRAKLVAKQIQMRVFSPANTEELTKYKFDAIVKTYGVPVMIFQDKTGKGYIIQKLPDGQDALLKVLGPFVGGF
jgi:hypothetical protein